MQWLELPDGTICELTGSYIRVRTGEPRGKLTEYPNDFQIILSGGSIITGSGKSYIGLVEESDASQLMLNSNLGSDLVNAIFLFTHEKITASQLAYAAYSIARNRHIRAL